MKKEISIYFCDICNKETEKIVSINYPVLFTSDQTEGRSCEQYISYERIDLCEDCLNKAIKITGYGAQGCNHYSFIKEKE